MPDYNRMRSVLDTLGRAQAEAEAKVGGFWTTVGAWTVGASSSQAAQETLLAKTRLSIAQLSGPLWMEVLGGQRTEASWQAYAEEVLRTLQSIDGDLSSWTLSGVMTATAGATVTDVKEVAAVGALTLGPLLALGAGLYLFVILGPFLAKRG
jgi:hypothetical protein